MRSARLAAALAVVLAVALPSAAHADAVTAGSLTLIDKTETIGPGITLRHVKELDQGGWQDEQFLTAQLDDPDVRTNLLTAGPVASGGPLSIAVNQAGAVAGINGDFFDIGNSTAAEGPEVQSGRLLKSASVGQNPQNTFGVTDSGVAQLVNAAVTASATFGGTAHPVASINAADSNTGGAGPNALVAFTSDWGTFSRARPFTGVTDLAEALVVDGQVVSVNPTGAGADAIPSGGFALVGTGTSATALRALAPGDPASLAYGLSDSAAQQLRFAIGDGGEVVSGGQVVPGLDPSVAPRAAIGFKDDGHTLVLATWDGPGGTGVGGIGINTEAADLVADGVTTAVNLDGGGSTTMVARALGAPLATVRNVPSDGMERSDPNGVGVFVSAGDGRVHTLEISPGSGDAALDGSARVFPGMHRTLVAGATDSHETPVALADGAVRWLSTQGRVSDGLLSAPLSAHGVIDVRAANGSVQAAAPVRVLGPLSDLEVSSDRLSIPDADAADAVDVSVTGRDGQGYTAPVEPEDLSLSYDHSVISVTADGSQFKVTPLTAGGTVLTVSAQGKSVQLPISVGTQSETAYTFDDDVTTRWVNNSTTATTFSKDPDGLRIDFPGMRNVGIAAATAADRVAIPGQPVRVRVKIKSTISVPNGLTFLDYVDGDGNSVGIFGTGLTASDDWQFATFTLPANTVYPISVQAFQGINTDVTQQKAGTFILGDIEADVPTSVDLPAPAPPAPDTLVSDDGRLPGGHDWTFGTLSDIDFTTADPDLSQVATTAIHRIRRTHPDLIVLNGDISGDDQPQDLANAREVLQNAGCDLIPVGSEPPPGSTPSPNGATIPCYYVPGNHEAESATGATQDLTNFTSEFGQPYRTFDHKGTRFILLASSLGTLRGTAWAQLPMFQQALHAAEHDPSVHNVVVFAHHPVQDPTPMGTSQLADPDEVALIEKMLTDFRDSTGKGAAMIGSHAQVAAVQRIEGVPYTVLPPAGQDPSATPDQGGFTGWADWAVDPARAAAQQWLTVDLHAFAQSVTLNAPASVAPGSSAPLSGSIVQPAGVSPGTRVVPLQYPMSVDWGGSGNLAIGGGPAAISDARQHGMVAILDPETRMLTGLRPGSVTVSVTSDSLRAYTGASSLAPIVTQKTIQVTPSPGRGPQFTANTPVFSTQAAHTAGSPQAILVRNAGNRPLRIARVQVRGARRQFRLAGGGCRARTLAPHGRCTMLVRFAPRRASRVTHARLVFATNTAAHRRSIALTGRSVRSPVRVMADGVEGVAEDK
jgi:hypothetical protein